MAVPHVFVTYTIRDGEAKESNMQIKFPIDTDIGILRNNFVPSTATLLNAIITGKIVSAGIGIGVDLSSATIRSSPDANSDVEEGALFPLLADNGDTGSFRIPTFDEDLFFAGTNIADPSNSDLAAFITRIISGQTVTLTNVSPSTLHGEDVTDVGVVVESFQSTRH